MVKGLAHSARLERGSSLTEQYYAFFDRQGGRRTSELDARYRAAANPIFLTDLRQAFERFGIDDGATLSFHHHYRNGDRVLAAVIECAAELGLKGLTIAASSIFPAHAPIVPHIQSGVVTNIITDYVSGPVAAAITAREVDGIVVFQSHGGRARAIATGELPIDVAFIGASKADMSGAATGREGRAPCGPLGYSMVDAAHAKRSIVLADEIVWQPITKVDIPASQVDALLLFPHPGQPSGISFGSTVPLNTREAQLIGRNVVNVIRAAGLLRKDFSFQTGAGGYSLGCVPHIERALCEAALTGDFISGGISGAHVEIAGRGKVQLIKDVQCFDQAAVQSSMTNDFHTAMSAAEYASPIRQAAVVNDLSVMVLGAAEIDSEFNINVVTGGNGKIIGGPGGHPDTARGAKLTIATTRLAAGGYAKLVEQVACIATPGRDVDVLVTDEGIAVNAANGSLSQDLKDAGISTVSIDHLIERSRKQASRTSAPISDEPCALIETPNGQIADVIMGEG